MAAGSDGVKLHDPESFANLVDSWCYPAESCSRSWIISIPIVPEVSSIYYASSVLFLLGPVLTHKTHPSCSIQESRENLEMGAVAGKSAEHLKLDKDARNPKLPGTDWGRATRPKFVLFFLRVSLTRK